MQLGESACAEQLGERIALRRELPPLRVDALDRVLRDDHLHVETAVRRRLPARARTNEQNGVRFAARGKERGDGRRRAFVRPRRIRVRGHVPTLGHSSGMEIQIEPLVEGIREALAGNLVGAYLHGSAATWALARLPEEHRPVLERARAVFRGDADEEPWNDVFPQVRAYAAHVVSEIRRAV
jgi:hypothetical protein